ncbi:DUF6691 family protein [Azorhizobium doebereinerae]|uniref:DUF6691 family protein n=1 Tax=Azorhizobium doebereinerae TaxID=281091 RepID=UPI0004120080|nr:DUF6691 family protein [Azorhizobium doebereinerae]
MGILAQLLAGLVFGLGLVISGMANPAKVLNFLDVAGTWDPSLAFVMAGAVAVTFIGFRLVLARPRPLFAAAFQVPTRRDLEPRLIVGPAIFGIGWGLSGLCPGPAFTALALAAPGALVFMPAMLAGMAAARWLATRAPAIPSPSR